MYTKSILCWTTLAALATARSIPKRSEPAPLYRAVKDEHRIPGMYIVKMKDGLKMSDADSSLAAHMKDAKHVYSATGFKGFASSLDDGAVESLRSNPQVDLIKEDQMYYLNTLLEEENAPYGIARISHRAKGDDGYIFDSSEGAGTCIYMIDTGINITHPDFGGRAVWGNNFADSDNNDGQGHGTFTAGIAGSNTYGVAKATTLIAVKVFDDTGATAGNDIIAGIDWVGSDSQTRSCPNGIVANLSLGGGYDATSNAAVAALVQQGIFVAVASGNSDEDASGFSPASEPTVCTVSASDENDAFDSYSNYGSVVDIFAPGTDITSTSYMGGSTTASGTSASSPIIAGLGAYLMALDGSLRGGAVCDHIVSMATNDVLSGVPSGTVNALAFNDNPIG
ncbi:peptidase S8/S53 domain-containing protein [Xylariaceae sp. FL0255]|nr:peptidase S8/S53 domain-containing protein [Xylariaceae sp. FL0255]